MKFNKLGSQIRKWSRTLHRDFGYFFSGMILIYAISGFVMNHRDSINPNYTIDVKEFVLDNVPPKDSITQDYVLTLLKPLDEDKNYTKHYFPEDNIMKVFLKGGSNFLLNLSDNSVVYEKLTRRPILGALTKLHYNPGKWWTWFSDIFAFTLIFITLTGIIMVKGNKGVWGRGGIELLLGILIPLLFLFL